MNNLGSTCIDNATYQVSRSSVFWLWRRRFFKVFTIYGQCCPVGHVTQLICINFHSYSHFSFHMSFGSKSPNCLCEKQVLTLKSEWPLTKVKEWPWPLILTQLPLVECFKQLSDLSLQQLPKNKIKHFFPYKSYVNKFDLGVKWVRSTQGHNLNNLGSTCIDNAIY